MRLNTKINEEASGEGLFFMCYLGFFFCVLFFLGGRFYKRDGNDMREVEMI